jgi:tetratricopeptide (TPR) repeat protein
LVDNEIIKYLITKFEERIRANPLTPEFAKLANYYLINGNIDEAINILNLGLNFYPEYVTARLLLGKCYLANRYYFDAKKIFESLLIEYPEMGIAKKYIDIAEELTKNHVSRRLEQDIIPKLEFKAPEFNDYDFNYNLFPSYEIDEIAGGGSTLPDFEASTDFLDFKKIFESPHFFKRQAVKPSFERKRLKNKFEVKIITETLADIFAKQGNYFDAIEAYTYLLKNKPERKEQLESKINEVETQIQKLINDF